MRSEGGRRRRSGGSSGRSEKKRRDFVREVEKREDLSFEKNVLLGLRVKI